MSERALRTYWLDREGSRVLIGPASLLVGRSADCDVIMADGRVSRHHALFRLTDDGVEVIPFGREPVMVNGEARVAPTALRAGDRVGCCEQEFTIAEATPSRAPEPDLLWGVERSRGALFRIAQSPFRVGGAASDHLIIVGWPETVLALHQVGNALTLEAAREGVRCGEAELSPGECVPVANGARIVHQETSLRVVALPADPSAVTASTGKNELPSRAELLFLPRGGRLTVRVGARDLPVYLPDRRCDLIACLLKPPAPFAPGDVVPDHVLLDQVWPNQPQGRVELNTLVFRTRKDLIKADIDGAVLLERQGGGVRMRLAPGAAVRVDAE